MKKYINYLAVGLFSSAFVGCTDYNSQFPSINNDIVNLAQYEHTIDDADISNIVVELYAKKTASDSILAKQLSADKMFSDAVPAETLIPYTLDKQYYAADDGSTADVSYLFNASRSSLLTNLSTPSYPLTMTDYQAIWGSTTTYVEMLTPNHSPEKEIPALLNKNFPDATDGMAKTVEYSYSSGEPTAFTFDNKDFPVDFQQISVTPVAPIAIAKWVNVDLKGASKKWLGKAFEGNNFAEVTAYKSTDAENDAWLIPAQIDLSTTTSPKLTFDVECRFPSGAALLKVYVSTNFDGVEANVSSATWVDVTNKFTIPTASTNSVFVNAGSMDLSAYVGQKIYVAYRYQGNATAKSTTTYRLDNINVYELESKTEYATYISTAGAWALADNSIVTLQPDDYTEMGLRYMSINQAGTYLPTWLKTTYIYAQENDVKRVVYKINATDNYADEFTFKGGQWEMLSTIENRTGQYVYSSANRGWVFDPTLRVVMKKGKTPTDDYMMVVNYVIASTMAQENPLLIGKYKDAEYYYGFNGNYGNITYRESDRSNDLAFKAIIDQSADEKKAFLDKRTIEGLTVYLNLKFPDAQVQVAGIAVSAYVTTNLYDGVSTYVYTYKFNRVDTPDRWAFDSRELNN